MLVGFLFFVVICSNGYKKEEVGTGVGGSNDVVVGQAVVEIGPRKSESPRGSSQHGDDDCGLADNRKR